MTNLLSVQTDPNNFFRGERFSAEGRTSEVSPVGERKVSFLPASLEHLDAIDTEQGYQKYLHLTQTPPRPPHTTIWTDLTHKPAATPPWVEAGAVLALVGIGLLFGGAGGALAAGALLAGCAGAAGGDTPREGVEEGDAGVTKGLPSDCYDNDQDSFYSAGGCGTEIDCNDRNGNIFPGAPEFCDYLDNDCDGETDEGVQETFYADMDEDGFGDPSRPLTSCLSPQGDPKDIDISYANNDRDCDDLNPEINPNEREACDRVDNNCSGTIDEDLAPPSRPCTVGVGECASSGLEYQVCEGEAGWSSDYRDCDAVAGKPEEEVCDGLDNNCNGISDEGVLSTFYEDNDGDGFGNAAAPVQACDTPPGHVAVPGDCNDFDEGIHPDALELCDGRDNNCRGGGDEVFVNLGEACDNGEAGQCFVAGAYVCSADRLVTICNAPPGVSSEEVCDGLDNDCDGGVDEDLVRTVYSGPAETDGIGICQPEIRICEGGAYLVEQTEVLPQPEICDGLDNDCDGVEDNGLVPPSRGCSTGVGECRGEGLEYQVCEGVAGWSADYRNCDAVVGAPVAEICDELDNDCDEETDEGLIQASYSGPAGTEGVGVCRSGVQICEGGVYVFEQEEVLPAAEACDGTDNDCDGEADEGLTQVSYSGPAGTEGVGPCRSQIQECSGGSLTTTQTEVLPAAETCNGLDDNCDGSTDEGVLNGCGGCSALANPPDAACDGPDADLCSDDTYVCAGTDATVCSAGDNTVEVCNDTDDDCDRIVDEGCDDDADNWCDDTMAVAGPPFPAVCPNGGADCDDDNAALNPGETEVCDSLDNDCDGTVNGGLCCATDIGLPNVIGSLGGLAWIGGGYAFGYRAVSGDGRQSVWTATYPPFSTLLTSDRELHERGSTAWSGDTIGIAYGRGGDPSCTPIYSLRLSRSTASGTLLGTTTAGCTDGVPSVIWDGSGWAAVWRDAVNVRIYFRRLASDGTPLGSALEVGALGGETGIGGDAVASTGASYYACYANDALPRQIRCTRISADGSSSLGETNIDGSNFFGPPAVAWNGERLGVVWGDSQVAFAELDADGAILTAPRITSSSSLRQAHPDIAWDGTAWGVVHDSTCGWIMRRVAVGGAVIGIASDCQFDNCPGRIVWNGSAFGVIGNRGDGGMRIVEYTCR